eukprot:6213559-Pleurochrysis_carterae.AAC.4
MSVKTSFAIVRPSRSPAIYLETVVARAFHLQLTLACTVCRFGLASHGYSRSARAPLPKFLDSRSRWLLPTCERPLLEPPHCRAPAPAPAPAPSPPAVRICIIPSALARPDERSGRFR